MKYWALAILGIVFIGAAAVVLIVLIRTPPSDDPLTICRELIPKDETAGFKLESEGAGKIKVDIGQASSTQERDTKETAEIIGKITDCAEKMHRDVTVVGGVNLPEEPLGEVADRWNDEQGLHVDLRATDEHQQEFLNNLRVPPSAGTKAQVIQSFCHENASCIDCSPMPLDQDSSHVTISLKTDAKLAKVPMIKQPWPVPNPGTKLSPWQLVDPQGKRWVFQCGG